MSGYTILILVGLGIIIFILSLFLYYDCEESNRTQTYNDRVEFYDYDSEGVEFLREMKNKDKEKNNKNDKSIK